MVSFGMEMHGMIELGRFDHKYGRLNGGLGHLHWDSGNMGWEDWVLYGESGIWSFLD